MFRKTRLLSAGCISAAIVFLGAPYARAQKLSATAGLFYNQIAPRSDYNTRYTFSRKTAFSFGFYFHDLLSAGRRSAFGLKLGHFKISGREMYKDGGSVRDEIDYTFFGLALYHRFRLAVFDDRFYFLLNNAIGFFGQSEDSKRLDYCDTVMCWQPLDFAPAYLPGFEYLIKINDRIAVQMIAQYVFIPGDDTAIHPFSSLATFQIGLGFSLPSGRKNNPTH